MEYPQVTSIKKTFNPRKNDIKEDLLKSTEIQLQSANEKLRTCFLRTTQLMDGGKLPFTALWCILEKRSRTFS
ncbi:hypothetical protein SRHO_G00193190 [Serrasalmus rhombeus]